MKKIIINLIILALLLLSVFGIFFSISYYEKTKLLNKKVIDLSSKIEVQRLNILELQDEITESKSTPNVKPAKHPLEEKLQVCMQNENYTTSGMNACVYDSIKDWEKEIDKSLMLLKGVTTKEQYVKIQTAQKEWLIYRENQSKINSELLLSKQGTIYTNYLAGMDVAIVQKRAEELHSLYYFYSK